MPGPSSLPKSSGGGTCSASAARGTSSQSLASSGCQQTKASRPPGRTADRMFANAATGSSKNITPNREMTASNRAGPNPRTCTSS